MAKKHELNINMQYGKKLTPVQFADALRELADKIENEALLDDIQYHPQNFNFNDIEMNVGFD